MSDLWRNHNFATSPTKSTYISKVCTVKRENTITYSGCNTVRNFLKKKKKSSFGFATWSNFFFPFQPSMSVKLFTWSGLFEPCSGKCIVSDEILCKLIFNFFFYYYFISVWHLWLYGILFDGSSFKGWKKKNVPSLYTRRCKWNIRPLLSKLWFLQASKYFRQLKHPSFYVQLCHNPEGTRYSPINILKDLGQFIFLFKKMLEKCL